VKQREGEGKQKRKEISINLLLRRKKGKRRGKEKEKNGTIREKGRGNLTKVSGRKKEEIHLNLNEVFSST